MRSRMGDIEEAENNNSNSNKKKKLGIMELVKYEVGKTLGEGNLGKVKLARNAVSGHTFALKIIDKTKIRDLNLTHQIRREIKSLKLLRHPNVVRLHEILKADPYYLKWLSQGAHNLLKRILDPNPGTRITMAGIKQDEWFKQDYHPTIPYDDEDEDIHIDDEAFPMHDEMLCEVGKKSTESPTPINAFQLIGMSSYLDLSGFFENEDVSERKIRFTSNHSAKDLLTRTKDILTEMGFQVQKKSGRVSLHFDMCKDSFSLSLVQSHQLKT